jgi:hypothetical protein
MTLLILFKTIDVVNISQNTRKTQFHNECSLIGFTTIKSHLQSGMQMKYRKLQRTHLENMRSTQVWQALVTSLLDQR